MNADIRQNPSSDRRLEARKSRRFFERINGPTASVGAHPTPYVPSDLKMA
jgi:hypothetical protein